MRRAGFLAAMFRILFYGFILFLLLMIFWSLEVLQEDVIRIDNRFSELEETISSNPVGEPRAASPQVKVDERHFDEEANFLKEDPFLNGPMQKMLGDGFVPSGIYETGTFGKPEHLHPLSPWAQVAAWQNRCVPTLGKPYIGRYEPFAKNAAIAIVESKKPGEVAYTVHLRDDLYWQPLKKTFFPKGFDLAPHFLKKHPITSADFKLQLDAVRNTHVSQGGAASMRTYLQDLIDLEIIDEKTFVVRWKAKEIHGQWQAKYDARFVTALLSPLPSFVYKYYKDGTKILEDDASPDSYRLSPAWGEQFSEHWSKQIIVSAGPWIFDGMGDSSIRFRRSAQFFSPYQALFEGIETTFLDSADSLWNAFKAGLVDVHSVAPEQLKQLEQFLASEQYQQQKEKGAAIKQLSYLTRAYSYIGWNQKKPWFQSKEVRRALTMSIDRTRLVKEILSGLAEEIHGTFHPQSDENNPAIKPLPYDPDEAKRLLTQAGWVDIDGDGYREKEIDGKQQSFRFSLLYFVKSATGRRIVEYVASSLKEVGIQCIPQGVDIADFSAKIEDRQFDAVLLAWSLGNPPNNPRQLWHSDGAEEKGSSNLIAFANKKADELIDTLEYESNLDARTKLYHQFDELLHQEQPYTFLYAPKTLFLYREYVEHVMIPKDHPELFKNPDVLEPLEDLFTLKKKPLQSGK